MIPSNTICVSQEGPANALALNKDCTQVVIAGRNVFKVFSIGENEFSEVCNLRVGKNLNLNFSSIDVAWSAIEENTLATAATNGAVVVWNLGRSGRSKQEHVFSDHKRTVNKVSFHLTEPALLISGSQDGMMKCFDLRMKEVARTFISNTESVRDVQFSPTSPHQFAAVSENGNVQVWDVRRHERCLHQFTAHSGPVFACDWHLDAPWLATASRDKTIKVWDMSGKPTLEHTIYTIASVGHVKWRPQKKYHISSCALVLDCAVHVWDVRRPHVPLATFAEHRDVTTSIAWPRSPHAFLSTSRDCTLYRHRFTEAAHPVLWANPHGVCLSRRELAQACAARALPPAPAAPAPPRDRPPPPALGRKQPTAGALSAAAQAALERAFPLSALSVLTRWALPRDGFEQCARQYRLRAADAAHNAQVAARAQRHMVAHVWEVVARVYSRSTPAPRPPPPPPPQPLPKHSDNNATEEEPTSGLEPMSEWAEWGERQFHNSGVLGLPTHTIYVPPAKYAALSRDGSGWVSAATAHYVDVDAADWTLPEEAFPLRPAPPPPPPPPPPPQHHAAGGSGGSASSPGGSSADSAPAPRPTNNNHTEESEPSSVLGGGAGAGGARGGAAAGGAALWAALGAALRAHAAAGDVQTAASVLLALHHHRSDLLAYIEESLQEQWLLGYIELLQRHKLYNIATEVIGLSWLGSVSGISQQSTSISLICGRCGRRARPHCDRCPRQPDICAVCKQAVRGLFAWCQGCGHGGHLAHMQAWLARRRLCPAGCAHRCQL